MKALLLLADLLLQYLRLFLVRLDGFAVEGFAARPVVHPSESVEGAIQSDGLRGSSRSVGVVEEGLLVVLTQKLREELVRIPNIVIFGHVPCGPHWSRVFLALLIKPQRGRLLALRTATTSILIGSPRSFVFRDILSLKSEAGT